MSRKVWVGFVLFASLGLAAFGIWSGYSPHHINREGFQKLRAGMTEGEVETTLGGTAGYYTNAPVGFLLHRRGVPDKWTWIEPKYWVSDKGAIAVFFEDGRVGHVEYRSVFVIEEPLLDRVRRRLGL